MKGLFFLTLWLLCLFYKGSARPTTDLEGNDPPSEVNDLPTPGEDPEGDPPSLEQKPEGSDELPSPDAPESNALSPEEVAEVTDLSPEEEVNDPGMATRGMAIGLPLWPGAELIYQFPTGVTEEFKTLILVAMKAIQGATGGLITFREDNALTMGVLVIYEGNAPNLHTGCYGQIGYRPKIKTFISVASGKKFKEQRCDDGPNGPGSAAHELMHALGFIHEFQRRDRELYMHFNATAVATAKDLKVKQSVFGQLFADESFNLTFNWKSIVNFDLSKYVIVEKHPPKKPIGSVKNMGQQCVISAGDRNLLEAAYCKLRRGPNAKPKVYKDNDDYPIKGTNCKQKLPPEGDDEMAN